MKIRSVGAAFDQRAEMEERGHLRDAGGLLHRVGDDDDGEVGCELVDQLFDLGGRDRIERRARLVHQDHFGANRDGAGDAEALLLAAGETGAACREAVA